MTRFVPWLRHATFAVFTLSCLVFAFHAFGYLYQGFQPGDPFHVSFAASGWAVPAHFFAAGLALALAPVQLSARIRARAPGLHRLSGWLYVVAVAIGGISGLLLAQHAQGGLPNMINFTVLSVLWLLLTGQAVLFAIQRDHIRHRRWMLRSVALTFAAVTLRAILGLAMFAGLPFVTAYTIAAWSCWTINLALCELSLRRPRRRHAGSGIGSVSGRARA